MSIYSILNERLEELQKQETTLETNLIPLDEVREEIKTIKQMLDFPKTLEAIKANQVTSLTEAQQTIKMLRDANAELIAEDIKEDTETKAKNDRLLEALQSMILPTE